ncbi:unnamed protein product, partial [Staurois parvus]
ILYTRGIELKFEVQSLKFSSGRGPSRVFPSVFPLTLGIAIRMQLYIMYSNHIRSVTSLSSSECPFTSCIPITLPPYIRDSRQIPLSIIFPHPSALLPHIPHKSAPFHHMCPSEFPLT